MPAGKNDPDIGVHDVAPGTCPSATILDRKSSGSTISRFSAVHKRCARAANAQLLYPKVKRGALDT
jgi:hypothetical protein